MPQQLPQQGKPGGIPAKPATPSPQPPKPAVPQSAFDRAKRGYITKGEFTSEIMKTPSVYPGRTYSKSDKMKIVEDLTKRYPNIKNIKKSDIPFIEKELEKGLWVPDAKKREENRRVLEMVKEILKGK